MLELHRSIEKEHPSLQEAIRHTSTPAEARRLLESYIDKMCERYLQTVPLTHEPVVLPIFRLFRAAAGYLDGVVWERQAVMAPPPSNVEAASRLAKKDVQADDEFAFSGIKMGLVALLLLSLFSALSLSWLIGVAFLLALSLLLLEILPTLLQVRDRFLLRLGGWRSGFSSRLPSFSSIQSGHESDAAAGEPASYRLRLNPEQLDAAFERMVDATDEAVAAIGDLLRRYIDNASPEPLRRDQETIQFLQHLLRDAQQSDAKYMRERIRQIPDLLRAQGLRLMVYEDIADQDSLDEYFQIFVDPSVAAPTTLLPAIVAEGGVVIEGRVVFPSPTLQKE